MLEVLLRACHALLKSEFWQETFLEIIAVLFYTLGVETLGCHTHEKLIPAMLVTTNGRSAPHI